MITEFARELLAQRGVKVVVPGEQERVVVSLSEEKNEAEAQTEEKNGSEEPAVTAAAGERCEVCKSDLFMYFLVQWHTNRLLLLCMNTNAGF